MSKHCCMQACRQVCRHMGVDAGGMAFCPTGDPHSWRGTLPVQGAAGDTGQAVPREEEATARGVICVARMGREGSPVPQALPLWKTSNTQRIKKT